MGVVGPGDFGAGQIHIGAGRPTFLEEFVGGDIYMITNLHR